MFRAYAVPPTSHGIRTAWLLIVMPRSRSMSIRSRYCARMARASTTPVICSIRSASVDLPWSMWAMMQKFRISSGGVADGVGAVRAIGDTFGSSLARDPGHRPTSPGGLRLGPSPFAHHRQVLVQPAAHRERAVRGDGQQRPVAG